MQATLWDRVSCSIGAASVAWLFSGVVFVLIIKGPGTVNVWLIWGTAVFLAGWILVGLPFIALGDMVLRMNTAALMAAAGLGGALVMELPYAIVRSFTPSLHFLWSVHDLIWPCLAFAIAAFSAWLYRTLLRSKAGRCNS
ncbi:MAG TPA: hypothetical protein VMT24_16040 [Aggregatilineaceae bacterium]|nr:hypothetical protein [Aggregatilineaceae bacterium]